MDPVLLQNIFFSFFGFLFGATFGSFVTAAVYRIKDKRSLVNDRSECEECHKKLKWYDNIPILSYMILRGKCRYCKSKIGIHYPITELISATYVASLTLLLTFQKIDLSLFILYIIFGIVLLIIVLSDYLFLEIPNITQILILIIGFVNLYITRSDMVYALVSAVFAAGFFYIVFRMGGDKKMGFGDVKLAFGLGLFFKFFIFIWLVVFSSFVGIILGIVLARIRGEKLNTVKVPFGSVLALLSMIFIFLPEIPLLSQYFESLSVLGNLLF